MSRGAEIYFEYQKSLSQFTYFQLGVAASAIAFAVHETSGRTLDDTPWPIGLAVLFWGVSFVVGCWASEGRIAGLNSNARYLFALEDVPPAMRNAPSFASAISEWKSELETDSSKLGWRYKWQPRCLFLGAAAYIGGHIMDMAGRVNPAWMIG